MDDEAVGGLSVEEDLTREEIRAARVERRHARSLARQQERLLDLLRQRERALAEPEAQSVQQREREERANAREERHLLNNVMGRDVSGATALLVALRYAMGGGYPFSGHYGGPILPFYDVLGGDSRLKSWYHHGFHEQQSGHFAEGLAASTGKVGVAVVTSGPGIKNLATACYDASMDSVPVVFISGNVPQAVAHSMAFQESDVVASFFRDAKRVYYVTDAKSIPSVVLEAFRLAKSGRPGPVVIDLPKDVLLETAEFSVEKGLLRGGLEEKVEGGHLERAALAELAGKLASAKRPLLYIGGGVKSAEAWKELRKFVSLTGIPVAYTLKGKGAYSDTDPLCIGMLGMHGVVAANLAAEYADSLVVIGARFDDRVATNFGQFAPNAYIAHLDIDPRGIGPEGPKQRQPHLVIKGDVRSLLGALNGLVGAPPRLGEWYELIAGWKRKFPLRYEQGDEVIKPQFVLEKLNELLVDKSSDVIYVTDVGQHQMWAAQYLQTSNPLGFITSGGGGTMGFGLSAALGAKLANPDKTVVLVSGESSFRMLPGVLEHYSMLGLDIKVVVIDNGTPDRLPGGMINQHFLVGMGTRTRVRSRMPSSVTPASIAQGYHVLSYEVKDPAKVVPSLEAMMTLKEGPVVVNFQVDPDELILPMIEAGKTVWGTILGYDAASNAPVRLREQFPQHLTPAV